MQRISARRGRPDAEISELPRSRPARLTSSALMSPPLMNSLRLPSPSPSIAATELPCISNVALPPIVPRSEEHTSELQSLMRISYAVFCLKKKKQKKHINTQKHTNQINN